MLWMRYEYKGAINVGCFELGDETIQPYRGDLFSGNVRPDGDKVLLSEVRILTPTVPSKIIALWNNYRALADEKQLPYPKTPLYLIKPPNTYLATGEDVRHPVAYDGEVFYEGELGIVIGKTTNNLSDVQEAEASIWGYTCINDVTAFGLLKEEDCFDQWTRAKGFDTFGVFGPCVATDLNDASALKVITRINGEEVQNYPTNDMILPPSKIVQLLSRNMTLLPGDVICCGTSVGLGPMPRGCRVDVEIPGIGKIKNRYI